MSRWNVSSDKGQHRVSSAPALALLGLLVIVAGGCAGPRAERKAVDHNLSDSDIELADRNLQYALNYAVSDATIEWKNAETQRRGTVTPLRTYTTEAGLYCREFRETITSGDLVGAYDGVACRDESGVWRPVNLDHGMTTLR